MKTELLKHGLHRYCSQKRCRWFSKCGLAITDKLLAAAKELGLTVKYRNACPNKNHTFDKRGKNAN